MRLSVIVVTLRAGESLLACLASIGRALQRVDVATEIVLIDNGAPAEAIAALRARFPAVRVLGLGRNQGFAEAINHGLQATNGEWLLLLNDDTTTEPDAVAELLHAAQDRPRVGSLAAQLRFASGGAINSAGIGVDRLGVAFDRHVGELPERSERVPTEVFGASAGAALMRRAMLEQIGGFDGSFFLYGEDVDVAWRAQMAGWSCIYVPAAVVHHHHSASSVHGSAWKHAHVGRNRVRLLAKHLPTAHLVRYGAAIAAYDVAYIVVAGLSDRTLAPLSGRLRGLREWRRYRRLGRDRRPVALAAVQGPRGALARRRAFSDHSYRP